MPADWRGAHVPPHVAVDALKQLVADGANLLRYQITRAHNDPIALDPVQWASWVRGHLDYLEFTVIPECEGKIHIVLDIHTAPGGMTGAIHNLWTYPEAYQALIDMWKEITQRFLGKTEPYVFGILNEPGGTSLQVQDLMVEAYTAIREIDSTRRISVTCPYSDAAKWNNVPTFTDNRVWYETHYYRPSGFCGQGIGGVPVGKTYPTSKNNKERMRTNLAKLRDWQLKYKKRIYVGEVGVSDFTEPEARKNYFKDFFALCEEYNWNWTYHAWFGEAPAWAPTGPTYDLLKELWAKNKKSVNSD